MKTVSRLLAILSVLAFSFAPTLRAQDAPPPPDQGAPAPPADNQDDQGASFQTFYDNLGDQGTWVQTDDYGYVFQPNVSDPNWAPYTDGHWVNTDQGWAWVSDEPWGWATYHYGRWANIDGTGWVWVPGYRWAPAWVSWRYGGGYCGWAPLPPESFVGVEFGSPGFDSWSTFHFGGDVDVSFGIGAGCYNFVSVGDFGESNYRGHYLDRSRNFAVINNTTNITNININRNGGAGAAFRGVSVGGPQLSTINAHSRQHVQTVQLAAANQPGRSTLQGNTLAVYAPHVNATTLHEAKPTRVRQTITHPTFNRGVSITKPMEVTASIKGTAPTPEAIQAAQTARLHAPAKAKIATEKTVPRTTLSQPLSSMEVAKPTHQVSNTAGPGAGAVNGANAVNPNVQQHPAAKSPYTGETVNPNTQQHPAVNSPYTGEATTSQADLAKQKKLDQQKEQHAQALQKARDSQPVHQAQQEPVVHPQQEQVYHPQEQQPVVHTQQQEQVYHPQPQPVVHTQQQQPQPQQQAVRPQPQAQPKAAPQPQATEKKEKKDADKGQGGPSGH